MFIIEILGFITASKKIEKKHHRCIVLIVKITGFVQCDPKRFSICLTITFGAINENINLKYSFRFCPGSHTRTD